MESYAEHDVVPHVLDAPPPAILKVEWDKDVKCMLGNELTPTQVQKQPSVLEWEAEDGALYTILFTDPDSPSRTDPDRVEVVHWLVFNIPGCDVSKGLVHAEYIESGPREETGFHRYVYLVYKQSSEITPHDAYRRRSPERRKPWDTRSFAMEYGLGTPIAGNFYIAQYDDYVPRFRAELLAAAANQ
ncbi:protein D3-like [Lytechinus variegatus]|uniref:protein D3-like n=1 Tax=Lytechinus variegatus TaxID=7654 RepID=UPI001BB0F97E|nr:protein D3-like [Lytechinus variegatus]XP_041463595.1 protein D3-like [Lytechinus variegatus]